MSDTSKFTPGQMIYKCIERTRRTNVALLRETAMYVPFSDPGLAKLLHSIANPPGMEDIMSGLSNKKRLKEANIKLINSFEG